MKMINVHPDEVYGKEIQAPPVKQLRLAIDRIRKNSPNLKEALAADALAMLLRIAVKSKDKTKRRAMLDGLAAMTKALQNS